MNIPHYSVPADPGSVRASSPTHSLLPWIGMAMPLIVGIVSTAVIVGERYAAAKFDCADGKDIWASAERGTVICLPGAVELAKAKTQVLSPSPSASGGGGGAVLWDEPRPAPTAEEILELVNVLADRRVKKALEELGEGSCLRKG